MMCLIQAVLGQYMSGADFAVSDLRMSTINRISLRPMIELDDERLTADQKSAYVKSIITGNENTLISLMKTEGSTKVPVEGVSVTVTPNDSLARIFFSLQISFKTSQSMEAMENVIVVVKSPSYYGNSKQSIDGDKITYPTQYVTTFDWKNFMFHFFEVVNVIFILAKLFIIIVRPFLPEYSKLRMIWIGGTVIFYELLCYTGLTPGNFGWTIDQAQQGMIAATRKHFWAFTVIEKNTNRPFMIYKFLENDFYPIVI